MQKEERMWAMACHLSALCGFIIPFGSIIAPLVIWLVQRDEMPLVRDQGKESLNFQISVAIGFLIGFILSFLIIGLLLLPVLAIYAVVMVIIASLKANEGECYRYPYTLRLIK